MVLGPTSVLLIYKTEFRNVHRTTERIHLLGITTSFAAGQRSFNYPQQISILHTKVDPDAQLTPKFLIHRLYIQHFVLTNIPFAKRKHLAKKFLENTV